VPAFALETFTRWYARRPARAATGGERVLLWPDTFNDHFHPDTAIAAVRVLEAAGFEVIVPPRHACCGRPLYDFGMLDRARAYLERVLDVLAPHLAAGHPIVVLEPSCASVFRDELVNLMPDREDAKKLQDRTMLLSEVLVREAKDWTVPRLDGKAVVQGHCHHKSVLHFGAERDVLHRTGLDAEVLESGCCGMAGAFGFSAATHEVATACGERALLPRVREAPEDTWVLADGFSCRQQIAQHTGRLGLHFAEVLALGLDGARPDGMPESEIRRRRLRDVRVGKVRAGLGIAALAGLGALGVALVLGRRTRR
jgi:Fe-S oxidoreductase